MIIKYDSIKVPKGIRFLSDWKEFGLSNFPEKCIIDKQLPGCGFTEYCIRSSENLVLCSPRKRLIKNKFDQHKKDVFLVVREDESDPSVDRDISILRKLNEKTEKQAEEDFINSENEIQDFLQKLRTCVDNIDQELETNSYKKLYKDLIDYFGKMDLEGKPYKILVTYDSYRLIKEVLVHLGILDTFRIVVDEFQSILHDARFKSTTEISFLDYLKQSPTTYFVSATPMMEEYLNMLEEFDGLPYFELDWSSLDPGRIIKPNLKVLTMKSTGEKAKEVIEKYLNKDYEKVVVKDKDTGELKEIVSDEAVLYMNSVNHIISIIKRLGLTPDQVTILCSDTKENRNKIKKKLGKAFLKCLSDIPLKGEKPKPFTFCTRTVYLGADFYSLCARTFIFSDSNLDCLAVDISDDLPQILGRQRLTENPWSNQATFYYRTTADWKGKTKEDFDNVIELKKKKSFELLKLFDSVSDKKFTADTLAETCESAVKADSYKKNYVAVNKIRQGNNKFDLIPVFNNLVLVNEIRAFRIAQIDYKDRFSVFSEIRNKFGSRTTGRNDEDLVIEFLELYDSADTLGKYKLLCESDLPEDTMNYILNQIPDTDPIKSNYVALGPVELKSVRYRKSEIERKKGIVLFNKDNLIFEIFNSFNIGDVIPVFILKEKLIEIYKKVGYNKSAIATDIGEFFIFKTSVVRRDLDGTGEKKRINAYKLLSVKPGYQENYNLIKGIIAQG